MIFSDFGSPLQDEFDAATRAVAAAQAAGDSAALAEAQARLAQVAPRVAMTLDPYYGHGKTPQGNTWLWTPSGAWPSTPDQLAPIQAAAQAGDAEAQAALQFLGVPVEQRSALIATSSAQANTTQRVGSNPWLVTTSGGAPSPQEAANIIYAARNGDQLAWQAMDVFGLTLTSVEVNDPSKTAPPTGFRVPTLAPGATVAQDVVYDLIAHQLVKAQPLPAIALGPGSAEHDAAMTALMKTSPGAGPITEDTQAQPLTQAGSAAPPVSGRPPWLAFVGIAAVYLLWRK